MDKESLQYCRDLALEVEDLDNQIEQLRAKAVSRKWPDGLPHSNFAADRLSGIVAKIADLDAAREPLQAELSAIKWQIEQSMDKLTPTERRLIRLRYLQALAWGEVAREMQYCERNVYYIHSAALEKFAVDCS